MSKETLDINPNKSKNLRKFVAPLVATAALLGVGAKLTSGSTETVAPKPTPEAVAPSPEQAAKQEIKETAINAALDLLKVLNNDPYAKQYGAFAFGNKEAVVGPDLQSDTADDQNVGNEESFTSFDPNTNTLTIRTTEQLKTEQGNQFASLSVVLKTPGAAIDTITNPNGTFDAETVSNYIQKNRENIGIVSVGANVDALGTNVAVNFNGNIPVIYVNQLPTNGSIADQSNNINVTINNARDAIVQ